MSEFIDGPADPFDPEQAIAAEGNVSRLTSERDQETVNFLLRRKEAYSRVFNGNALGDDVKLVVDDLRKFCRGETTTFDTDPRIHALLTGRQEVYIRIMDHTRLSLDALVEKYTSRAKD